jgi:hypothetical protein
MTVPSVAINSSDRWRPCDVALVWMTRSRPSAASAGSANSTPSSVGDVLPAGVGVDDRDLNAGEPGQQPRDAAAHQAGADDADPVAQQRCGIPERVDRRLHGAGQHGPPRRHLLRDDDHRAGRHHVGGLVRV